MDLFDLSGKVAVVTGSSRGIGRSIARTLANSGAKITVTSRKADACEAVAKEIASDGGHAIAVACNVSDKVQVSNLVKETLSSLGQVDILVCNAATNPSYGPMTDLEDRAMEKIFATNVQGPVWLINLVAPHMAKAGGGSIILLSSIAGLTGKQKYWWLCHVEGRRCSIGPEPMPWNSGRTTSGSTPLRRGLLKPISPARFGREEGRAFAAKTPLGRLGEPEDIAGVAAFLASDAAKFVTGQVIVADGGVMIADPF